MEEHKGHHTPTAAPQPKTINTNQVETTPPLPVQKDDDPRGHVGARDEQVDHTLTPPAPEESIEKVSR